MWFVCAESFNSHSKKTITQVYIEHSALYYNAFALCVLTETPRIRVHNTMILGDHVWGRYDVYTHKHTHTHTCVNVCSICRCVSVYVCVCAIYTICVYTYI
jgi:hypothetical protein